MAIRGVQADLFLADRSEWLWLSLKQEADAQTSSHWWLNLCMYIYIYIYRVFQTRYFLNFHFHQGPQSAPVTNVWVGVWVALIVIEARSRCTNIISTIEFIGVWGAQQLARCLWPAPAAKICLNGYKHNVM